jgi:hypothetical protein
MSERSREALVGSGRGALGAGLVLLGMALAPVAAAQGTTPSTGGTSGPSGTSGSSVDLSSTSSTSSDATTTTTTTTSSSSLPEPTPPVIESPSNQCVPECPASSECVNGRCESLCNPACSGSEVCTASGQCERLGKLSDSFATGARLREEKKREVSLVGIRGIAGLSVLGGMSVEAFKEPDGDGVNGPVNSGAFYAALKLGMTLDIVELSAEWAPSTNFAVLGNDDSHFNNRARTSYNNDAMSSLLLNIGVHLPLTQRLSWPIRGGGGIIQNKDTTDVLVRLDVFGISVKTKYVLLDVSLPSLRYASDFDQYHRFSGLVGLTASYITP